MARTIEIEDAITVGTLAEKLMLPVTRLIGELMKNGVMVTVNERIDYDTAQIIVSELGLDVSLQKKTAAEINISGREKRTSNQGSTRPPVVAVMGHVDHGKTSLLDAIRGAQVARGEAGGITQHISAYRIVRNGRSITFLDTPGHEAFAAIREHGAHLTDIAVIVVAADDGVKPQTVEAIRFARNAGAKIIVALNKIDKEGADPNRVKQQLAENNLLPEEWGGDTVIVEVSAKTKAGIDGLLDMILLVADVEDYRAETNVAAAGLIIESHLEHGRGPIANALVEEGILRQGEFIVAGSSYAKVRTLQDTSGEVIKEAGPSTPVVITGFKTLPEFGDEFSVVKNEKIAREHAVQAATQNTTNSAVGMSGTELLRIINRSNELQELNVILKADVQGSLTSVTSSIKALETEEVAVRLVSSGVGTITENDVHLAATTGATIYGFNVTAPTDIKRLAARDKVKISLYDIIYELLDDIRTELSKLLAPKIVEKDMGTLQIKAIFKTTKSEIICGGEVTKGKLTAPASAYVMHDNDRVAEVEVTNLKRGPQDAKEVVEGEMCGVNLKPSPKLALQENDILQFFTRETVERSL